MSQQVNCQSARGVSVKYLFYGEGVLVFREQVSRYSYCIKILHLHFLKSLYFKGLVIVIVSLKSSVLGVHLSYT